MLLEIALTILLAGFMVLCHDTVIRLILKDFRKLRMVIVMLILAALHTLQLWIYAVGLYIAVNTFHLGTIKDVNRFMDYVYFSATNYTSLGYGDHVPTGGIQLLSTFECLIGLLMIGWSTAFAFWWMEHHWLHPSPQSSKDD